MVTNLEYKNNKKTCNQIYVKGRFWFAIIYIVFIWFL